MTEREPVPGPSHNDTTAGQETKQARQQPPRSLVPRAITFECTESPRSRPPKYQQQCLLIKCKRFHHYHRHTAISTRWHSCQHQDRYTHGRRSATSSARCNSPPSTRLRQSPPKPPAKAPRMRGPAVGVARRRVVTISKTYLWWCKCLVSDRLTTHNEIPQIKRNPTANDCSRGNSRVPMFRILVRSLC